MLTALSALWSYVDSSTNITFHANSMQFNYSSIDGSMSIDSVTARNLELVHTLTDANASLFAMMNHTKTNMGARLLRNCILQPLTDLATIESRLDCTKELLEVMWVFIIE